MYRGEVEAGRRFALFSRRHYSTSFAGRVFVFGSLAFVTLAISLALAMFGAWPVLPFAGLECMAIFLAFWWLQRYEGDYELVTIEGDSLIVECSVAGEVERHSFEAAWVQVVVEERSPGPAQLVVRSHGREVQVGKLLIDENAKRAAAKRIRERLSGQAVHKD